MASPVEPRFTSVSCQINANSGFARCATRGLAKEHDAFEYVVYSVQYLDGHARPI